MSAIPPNLASSIAGATTAAVKSAARRESEQAHSARAQQDAATRNVGGVDATAGHDPHAEDEHASMGGQGREASASDVDAADESDSSDLSPGGLDLQA